MKLSYLTGVALTSVLLAASSSAMAADVAVPESGYKPYVSLFAGASFLDRVNTVNSGGYTYSLNTDTGYLIGGAIGVKFNDFLRTEIELSHMSNQGKNYSTSGGVFPADGPLKQTFLLGNVWLDIPTNTSFTPYAGGGIGVGFADADIDFNGGYGYGSSRNGAAFAYQIGAGVKFNVTENIDVDLGYRYKGMSNVDFEDNQGNNDEYNGADLHSHNVQLGLTFSF